MTITVTVSVCLNGDMKYLLILVLAIALTVEANPILGLGISLPDLPLVNDDLLGLGSLGQILGGKRNPHVELEKIQQGLGALGQKIPGAIHGLGANHGLGDYNPISGISSGVEHAKKNLDVLDLKI